MQQKAKVVSNYLNQWDHIVTPRAAEGFSQQ